MARKKIKSKNKLCGYCFAVGAKVKYPEGNYCSKQCYKWWLIQETKEVKV